MSGKPGTGKETLRGWARQGQIDAGNRAGATSEEIAQIKDMKAKVRSLRGRERDPAFGSNFLRVNVTLRGSGRVRSLLRCYGSRRWLLVQCPARPGALASGRGVA